MEQYDSFNSDCNELIRLLMMFVDRCSRDEEACREVFAALERQTSKGIYPDEDIERFKF